MHMLVVIKNSDRSKRGRYPLPFRDRRDLPHGLCLTYRDVNTKNQELNDTDEENETVMRDFLIYWLLLVAPTIILMPKAARDKGWKLFYTSTREVTKKERSDGTWLFFYVTFCAIYLCVSRCRLIYRNTNTNGIKIDSTIFFSTSWKSIEKLLRQLAYNKSTR